MLSTLSLSFGQTTYYLASSGDDTNSGRTSNDPFRTIAKINSLSLRPGDQVLLRRSDTFRGSLQIHQSGSSGNPIIIDAYGSGNKPIIAGSLPISNWTNRGNNIWQANCPECGSEITGLYRNAVALPLGRYPNLNDTNRGYLTIQSHSDKTQLTSQQGLSTNWTGGEAVVRPVQWILDRALITNQSGNTLTLANNSAYSLNDGWGYFIQNHPATLDQAGEWYYNPLDKTIQLFFDQGDPNSQLITATVFSQGVNLTNVSFVTVRNIQISETLTTGLAVNGSSNLILSANDITKSGMDAVDLSGTGSDVLLENNLIEEANNTGVFIDNYQNLTLRGNTIQRIGLVPGRGRSGDGASYTGLHSQARTNLLLENNVVDNIGYNGITVVSNTTIRYNVISNFCLTKSDGSGIYSWNNDFSNPGGLHIISNIVFNGIGAPEGTSGGVYAGANGIFLDDCSQNSEIINNTTFNSRAKGILLRGTSNITLKGNTSFNNGEEQLRLGYNENCTFRNNTIQDNIFFSRLAEQLVVDYESKANDLNQYGQFDHNYYVRPFEDQFKIQAVYNPGSGLTGKVLTLTEWQTQWNQDQNSVNSPITYKKDIISQTGASLLNNSFSATIDGWGVWSPYGNGRVSWDNTNRVDGGSLQVSFASASNQSNSLLLATINLGTITKGKTYQLLFDGVASGAGKRVQVYPRQYSGNYSDLAARTTYVLTTQRQAYEAIFTATADESNAILVLQVEEDGQTAWFDNIRLQEATLTAVNPDDYIKLVYNPTFQDKVQSLDGVYRDAKNNVYTNQVTVGAYSSVVLMKQVAAITPPVSLRDPENPTSITSGLDYRYYEGAWSGLPDFSSLTAAKTGTTSQPDLSVRSRDSYFGLQFKGYFDAPTDGTYTFYTTSDDGSKLYIGSTEVVSNDGQHAAQEKSGSIGLKAGKHALTIAFFQGNGDQALSVSYDGPSISKQVIPASAFYRVPTTTITPTPTGSGVYLSDLSWSSAINGYGPVEKDQSNGEAGAGDGHTITLNGQTYAKGLGTHAASDITYNLTGQYTRFLTDIGIDDEETSCGSAVFNVYVDDVLVYSSGVMTPSSATQSISLDVTGKQTLRLVLTDGGDGFSCDHGDWAAARLTPATSTPGNSSSGIYLSDLSWSSATNGYGPVEKDQSNGEAGAGDGHTITLNGQTYAKGLGAHASSTMSYNLGGQYTQFITDMGLDDEINSPDCGNVEFQIYLDGTMVFRSSNMNAATATKSVTLDVSGKQTLTLMITDGGDGIACDHGDWAGARLTKASNGRIAAKQLEIDGFMMKVYPNPAGEILNVRYWAETPGNLSLQLLNEAAQPVLQQVNSVTEGENLIRLPVQTLTRGFYILSLIQGQQHLTQKIILIK